MARNVGSLPAEAIPFIGATVIVGVTALDVYDACETMKDMHELNAVFEPEQPINQDVSQVCGTEVPSVQTVWSTIDHGTEKAWKDAMDLVPALPNFQTPTTLIPVVFQKT